MKARVCGFSLIELLVVIAIIAILAAILFPVFTAARAKARSTACLAYCKQSAIAIHNYTADWNETLPPYINWVEGSGWRIELMWTTLQPYIKSKKLYFCPETGKPDASFGSWSTPPYGMSIWGSERTRWQFAGYQGSYCINGWLYYDLTANDWTPLKLSIIAHPAWTMAFSDGNWVDAWVRNTDTPTGGDLWRIYLSRHNGGINVVFLDGNARWIPKDRLVSSEKSKRRIIYNPRTED